MNNLTEPLPKEELERLYIHERMGTPKIGELFQRSETTIVRWLNQCGIPIRSNSEAQKGIQCREANPRYVELPPKEEIERLYIDERLSLQKIADMCGCSESTIRRRLRWYSIPVRTISESLKGVHVGERAYQYLQPAAKEELERLYINERKNLTEIGLLYGCSPSVVLRWLSKHNIPTRTLSESKKGFPSPKRIESPPKEELERLYIDERRTPMEIGATYKCEHKVVRRWLRAHDIPIRTLSESKIGLHVGEKSPNWRGGISFEPYCHKFNESFKESIREKFGRVCFLCPTTEAENGRKLGVHHVNYNKDCLCDDSDCEFVPLCNSCHTKTNHNRYYWESYIMAALWYRGLTGSQGS